MIVAPSVSLNGSGLRLDPVRARRGVDCLVLCGACDHVVGRRHRDHVLLVDAKVNAIVELLPATVDCPFCHVPNLLDPKLLNVDCPDRPA